MSALEDFLLAARHSFGCASWDAKRLLKNQMWMAIGKMVLGREDEISTHFVIAFAETTHYLFK